MAYKDKDKQREAQRERTRRYREKTKGVTSQGVTQGVTDLELCRYCGEQLPALAKPRRHPGACYPCALKQPRKPSIVALGDTVYVGAEYVPPAGD